MDLQTTVAAFIALRRRFRAETTAEADALAHILRLAPRERDHDKVERCFARLSRLRTDLVTLSKERHVIRADEGFRRLRLMDRRAVESDEDFGADPRRLLTVWNRVLRGARIAVGFDTHGLYPEERPDADADLQRWAAMDRAMIALHEYINPRDAQDEAARDAGYFSDIPLPTSTFIEDCHAAMRVCLAQERRAPMRFLDIGCGGGVKVLLASQFFAHAHGLEVDPGYYASASALLSRVGRGRCDAMLGNALTFDGYGDYDVLYFYQPIKSESLLQELERIIADRAFAGTVLIAPYDGFTDRGPGLGCARVARHVWLAGTSPQEAEKIATRARQMGTVITPVPIDAHDRAGVLFPIVEALNDRGFEVA